MKLSTSRVDSSVIKSIHFVHDFDILYIEFMTGSCWIYHNVSYHVYRKLISAHSIGGYFNASIRNNIQYDGQCVYQRTTRTTVSKVAPEHGTST